jgi:hypothetical protein
LSHYGLITEQSRKARAARGIYDYLKHRVKHAEWDPEIIVGDIHAISGISVPETDKNRVLNLKIHDEYLSPYFKTDMNLFHLLMMDDSVRIKVYRADKGWLFIFEGIPIGPKPFGQHGFDTR